MDEEQKEKLRIAIIDTLMSIVFEALEKSKELRNLVDEAIQQAEKGEKS